MKRITYFFLIAWNPFKYICFTIVYVELISNWNKFTCIDYISAILSNH